MPYSYNPHRHVKIWISKNPGVFMNLENQIRLIKMRIKNPKDTITLFYDSSVLNEQARADLKAFCQENHIEAYDVHQIAQSQLSEKEQRLYKHYKKELAHMNNGGNLAVSSDILRWIRPVYELGTYMDFDAPVDTSKLPPTVTVQSPFLVNMGSLKLGKDELILLNNDTIAIIDGEAAKEHIEKIQSAMLEVLESYDSDFIENGANKLGQSNFFYKKIVETLKKRKEVEYIEKSSSINAKEKYSSLELRALINEVTANPEAFIEFNRSEDSEAHEDIIKKLRTKLSEQLNIIKWLFFRKEYNNIKSILAQDDKTLIHYLMKKERFLYLKSIVLCTTGPVVVTKALFDGYFLNSTLFKEKAAPMSFGYYGLDSAFQSPNSIPLYQSPLDLLKYLDVEDGELNDASWLEEGVQLQKKRESQLEATRAKRITELPDNLLAIKNQFKQKIRDIEEDQKRFFGLFGFYRKQERHAKIDACKAILDCFHEDKNEFSIEEFRTLLTTIYLKKNDVFASLFMSHTQELIQKLEQFCTDGQIFRIATGGNLLVSSPK